MEESLPYISYNSSNKDWARYNRLHPTEAERLMRNVLRRKQTGYIFLRQKMIGSFILDFYCSKLLLGIEVDGEIHKTRRMYDVQRDETLRHHGIKIIRYKNNDVFNNLPGVYSDILEELEIRQRELDYFHPPG